MKKYCVKEAIYAKCKRNTRIVTNGFIYKVEHVKKNKIIPLGYSNEWCTFATYDTFNKAVAGREGLIKQMTSKADTWIVIDQ